ncbi:hypothetical protein BDV06DRAFT_226232 [Aspergillus oleicola]
MATLTPNPSQPNPNPFDQLLLDCENDPSKIQTLYETHRTNRNAQFREKLLHPEFPGWRYDEILSKLIEAKELKKDGKAEGDGDVFADHRHNLNIYARPPEHIRHLIATCLLTVLNDARSLWIPPPQSLHVTTLEIASSRTKEEIDALALRLVEDGTAEKLVNHIPDNKRRVRLINPVISFDDSAIALSFLPAPAGTESSASMSTADHDQATATTGTVTGAQHEDSNNNTYTYHHLRRDLASEVLKSGVNIAARYIVPSAHITIARFVEPDRFWRRDGDLDRERIKRFVHYASETAKNEWVIGLDHGLEFNKGASWYGGGERVLVGRALRDL